MAQATKKVRRVQPRQKIEGEDDPSTTSAAYERMAPKWALIEALLGGTEAMREAADAYLPRHEEETSHGYDERLAATTLYNMTEQTLNNLAGQPFTDEVRPDEDTPEVISDTILPDVDLQGNNISVFCRQWFKEGFAKAFCHVLVDFPRVNAPESGVRTIADDRREGMRPYWVLIKPEHVFYARKVVIDGAEVLQHVRIMEHYTEQVGFAEVHKKRIRILEPGHVQLWEPAERRVNNREVWGLVDEWDTKLDYIPLVTFYAAREDFMYGKPPLEDLAWLNVTHWQSSSDQRHILTVGRFPILACSGASAEDSDPIVIGPNRVLYNADPQGKFYYVEHQGSAIKAGNDDLERLENQMAAYGAQFLKDRPGSTTATARALDSAEASSDLAAIVTVFEDAVAQVLDITADWMDLAEVGGSVTLNKSYTLDDAQDAPALAAIQSARDKKDISRKTYLNVLRNIGVLPEDFDEEEDWEELLEEAQQTLGASFTELDPNGGNPPPPEGGTPPPEGGTPPPASGEEGATS